MLVPAIIYRDELLKLFAKHLYTEGYFYYNGYAHSNGLPEIRAEDHLYQYAIIDNDRVVGYFSYKIWEAPDTAMNFGLFSFDQNNTVIGRDVYNKIRELIKTHRRIEWRMISGNKVQPTYDHLCKKFGGNKVILHDVCKDNYGNYHDEHIYEIVRR